MQATHPQHTAQPQSHCTPWRLPPLAGVVEVRYEADVPVALSSVFSAAFPSGLFRRSVSHPATAAGAAGAAGPGGGEPSQRPGKQQVQAAAGAGSASCFHSNGGGYHLHPEDTVDSSVHGSHVFDLGEGATKGRAGGAGQGQGRRGRQAEAAT